VFDIDIMFLYPWAVDFNRLGVFALDVEWRGSQATQHIAERDPQAAREDQVQSKPPRRRMLMTSMEAIVGWLRKTSFWPLTMGLACCAIEMIS
jgi:hypothetical protein